MPRSCHLFVPPHRHLTVPRKAPLEVAASPKQNNTGRPFPPETFMLGRARSEPSAWGLIANSQKHPSALFFHRQLGFPLTAWFLCECETHIIFFSLQKLFSTGKNPYLFGGGEGGGKPKQKTKPPQTEGKKKKILALLKNANSPAMP